MKKFGDRARQERPAGPKQTIRKMGKAKKVNDPDRGHLIRSHSAAEQAI
jgi:hypothetical protein